MRSISTRRITLAGVAVAGVVVTLTGGSAHAAPSATLVVNEAYGGGGNSGAALKNDFIELANRGTAATSLAGMSVQYIAATPGPSTNWGVTALGGDVDAGKTFLIAEAAGAGGTENLPTPDATGTLNLGGTAGTVALVRGVDALTCKTAADCAADPAIVDLVGWGGATVHEGSAAPATTNTTSAQRTTSADTDVNATDFTAGSPTPTPGATGTTDPGQPGPLRIHDIQGSGWLSPQSGNTVTNVPGVVTAVRTGSSKGFWIQDPTPDADPATSEGVLVFTGSTPTVKPGDAVLVTGKVSDYYALGSGETLSDTSSLSVTEITGPTVQVLSSDNALPAALTITPTTVPDTYAPSLGGGNIEKTTLDPKRSALDFYESIEGMRAQVVDARVVGPSNQYGEQYVTTKPDQARTPRGGAALLADNKIPSGRLEIGALDGTSLGLDVGDTLAGTTAGVIDWSTFGGYVLEADHLGAPVHRNLPPVAATAGTKKQLSIATYNVENLKPADPDAKYAALGAGVVTNLAAPDIVALEEIQDNTGATDDGTVAADRTLDRLTAAIKAAGGPAYQYRQISPVNDQDGGQPGGNIRVAFLFDPKRVSFVDRGADGTDRATTGTGVTTVHDRAALTLSPGRVDPQNPVWQDSRKPLAGEFRFGTKSVIVIANHWNSKGGDQNADGRFQYPKQTTRVQRSGQAQVVHDFVRRVLDTEKNANVVVVGDLNDYQFSPALNTLRTGTADATTPPILTDLITTLPAAAQYTYVYNGVSQVLDHILVSPALRRFDYQVVHVNAEYSDQVSDHDPQVVDITP